MFKIDKNTVLISVALLGILVTGVLLFANSSYGNSLSFLHFGSTMSAKTIANKSIDYLNKSVLQQGQTATLVSYQEESGIIKISLKIGTNSYDSYATKDGKLFFPEGFALDSAASSPSSGQQAASTVDISKVKIAGNPFVGNSAAPVVLAFWSDYQCPFCKKMEQETMNQVYDNYVKTGKVKIVYKDFAFLGDDSQTAALAGRAVWEVAPDKFYAWHEAMFQKQDAENSGWGSKADILALTQSLGIDSAKVSQLMTSKARTYQAAIDADKAEGGTFGITGTPGLIVGTQLVSGFTTYDSLKPLIDAVVK